MTEPTDPIEAYLDEVCKLLPFGSSNEKLAEGFRKTYGIDVSPESLVLPDKLEVLRDTARSEGESLRTELRTHLEASIARIEIDGVDHEVAVRQAIAEFGNPKQLNRLLRREFQGTAKERVRRVLDDHEQLKSKAQKRIDSFVQYGMISLLTWTVLTAKDHGRTLETAIPWITALLPASVVLGFLRTRSSSTNSTVASGMQSLFSSPDLPGSTLKQRVLRSFARSLFTNIAKRDSPSVANVVRSLCIRLALLVFFWCGPISGDTKFELFYYALLLLGFGSARSSPPSSRSRRPRHLRLDIADRLRHNHIDTLPLGVPDEFPAERPRSQPHEPDPDSTGGGKRTQALSRTKSRPLSHRGWRPRLI